ncbi:hypothetical protein BKA70DRAFT_1427769 [Coprinopsis sp. MPI-PUGE-AT-0042]|nr:hypothetical protein BKA70DRAFT_1427769 [Coprinopsis sp. MPI-PUGE-AT-0042]
MFSFVQLRTPQEPLPPNCDMNPRIKLTISLRTGRVARINEYAEEFVDKYGHLELLETTLALAKRPSSHTCTHYERDTDGTFHVDHILGQGYHSLLLASEAASCLQALETSGGTKRLLAGRLVRDRWADIVSWIQCFLDIGMGVPDWPGVLYNLLRLDSSSLTHASIMASPPTITLVLSLLMIHVPQDANDVHFFTTSTILAHAFFGNSLAMPQIHCCLSVVPSGVSKMALSLLSRSRTLAYFQKEDVLLADNTVDNAFYNIVILFNLTVRSHDCDIQSLLGRSMETTLRCLARALKTGDVSPEVWETAGYCIGLAWRWMETPLALKNPIRTVSALVKSGAFNMLLWSLAATGEGTPPAANAIRLVNCIGSYVVYPPVLRWMSKAPFRLILDSLESGTDAYRALEYLSDLTRQGQIFTRDEPNKMSQGYCDNLKHPTGDSGDFVPKECSGCRSARYCSNSCQTKDWTLHREECPHRRAELETHSAISRSMKFHLFRNLRHLRNTVRVDSPSNLSTNTVLKIDLRSGPALVTRVLTSVIFDTFQPPSYLIPRINSYAHHSKSSSDLELLLGIFPYGKDEHSLCLIMLMLKDCVLGGTAYVQQA